MKVNDVAVSKLALDPQNPRLPEELLGSKDSDLLRYLYDFGTLDEIAQSYLDNGFFPHEPLIAVKENGKLVVIEGNRRLATLMVLRGDPAADGLTLPGISPTGEHLESLASVPVYEVTSRHEARAYLGFRHIGGIKTWDADAKARYLVGEVKAAAAAGDPDPFKSIGRRVGSNALGVRNSFIALRVLETARDVFGIVVTRVLSSRFGVWVRCMNSRDLRDYIGLDSPKTYSEVLKALEELNAARLAEVISDMEPQEGYSRAVLSDSRQVTEYGRVLNSEEARKILREVRDITLASTALDEFSLPGRVTGIVDSCRVILGQLPFVRSFDGLQEPTRNLVKIAESMRDLVAVGKKSAT